MNVNLRIALIFICFLFSFSCVLAQNEGSVVIHKDVRLDDLLRKHKEISEYESSISGFRVQFFFDAGNNSQNNANHARSEFLKRYPDAEVYIIFESPFYKVRAGNFRTRLEAQHYHNSIHAAYPNAFIVRDKISYPKLD